MFTLSKSRWSARAGQRTQVFLTALVACSLLAFAQASAVAYTYDPSYWVGGWAETYCSLGAHDTRNVPWYTRAAEAHDTMVNVGPAGNTAEARYTTNLASGAIGAYSYAQSGYDPGSQQWLSARGISDAIFFDTINFSIPAGYYPSGITATARGRIEGEIVNTGVTSYAVGFSSWSAAFQRVLGGNNTYAEFGGWTQFVWGGQTYSTSQPFALSINLLDPGTTLAAPMFVETTVKMSVGQQASNEAEAGSYSGYVRTDFFNTANIAALDVPSGVTWSSASGVFLSAVPEPSSFLTLALGGLGAFLGFRRRSS